MGVEGVRSIQQLNLNQGGYDPFAETLWDYDYLNLDGSAHTGKYGWKYDFNAATVNKVILPSYDPAVFELKYPKDNVKGFIL